MNLSDMALEVANSHVDTRTFGYGTRKLFDVLQWFWWCDMFFVDVFQEDLFLTELPTTIAYRALEYSQCCAMFRGML
jgi:hypothetical protein